MVTFSIVAAVMLVLFIVDFLPIIKDRQPKVIVFYSIVTALSLTVITLHCFGVELPGIYGF